MCSKCHYWQWYWFEIYDYDGNLVQKIDLYPHDDIDIISADEKYAFVYWIQAQDGVGQEVIGVIERDKIATHEAELIQLTKGMNGNSFELQGQRGDGEK